MDSLTSKASEPLRRTTVTPLLPQISRKAALDFLHDHGRMIELNPLTIRHEPSGPAPNATFDEVTHYSWFLVTDAVSWIPGGSVKADVSYKVAYWSLPDGLKVHTFAPRGVDVRSFWSLEEKALGSSKRYCIREDVEVRCKPSVAKFVTRNLERSHAVLIDAILAKMEEDQHRRTVIKEIVAQGFALKKRRSASLDSSTDTTYLSSCNSSMVSPRTVPFWAASEARCARGDHGSTCPHSFNANCGPIDCFYPTGVAELPGAEAGILPLPSPTETKTSLPMTIESLRTQSPPSMTESSSRTSTETNTSVESLYSPVAERPCFCDGEPHDQACPYSVAALRPGEGKFPAPKVPAKSRRRYVEIPKDVASKVKAINSSRPAVHRQLAGAKSMAALQGPPVSKKSSRPALKGKKSFYGYVAGAQSVDALHGPTSAPRQDVEKRAPRSTKKQPLYQQVAATRSVDTLHGSASGRNMTADKPLPTTPSTSKPSPYQHRAGAKSMDALLRAQSETVPNQPLPPLSEEQSSIPKDPIIPSFLDFKASSPHAGNERRQRRSSVSPTSSRPSPYRHHAASKSVDIIRSPINAKAEPVKKQTLPLLPEEKSSSSQEQKVVKSDNTSSAQTGLQAQMSLNSLDTVKPVSETFTTSSLQTNSSPSASKKPSPYRHKAGSKSVDVIQSPPPVRSESPMNLVLPPLSEEQSLFEDFLAATSMEAFLASPSEHSNNASVAAPTPSLTSEKPTPYHHQAGAKSVDTIHNVPPVRDQISTEQPLPPLPPLPEEKPSLYKNPVAAQTIHTLPSSSSDNSMTASRQPPPPPIPPQSEKRSLYRNLAGTKSIANLRSLVSSKHDSAPREPLAPISEGRTSPRRQLPKTPRLITHWDGTTTGHRLQGVAR